MCECGVYEDAYIWGAYIVEDEEKLRNWMKAKGFSEFHDKESFETWANSGEEQKSMASDYEGDCAENSMLLITHQDDPRAQEILRRCEPRERWKEDWERASEGKKLLVYKAKSFVPLHEDWDCEKFISLCHDWFDYPFPALCCPPPGTNEFEQLYNDCVNTKYF